MSIEANTSESMTLHNVNAETAELAEKYAQYLLKTWGIDSLEITADGESYTCEEESFDEDIELAALVRSLPDRADFSVRLLSTNGGGLTWRRELFLEWMSENEDALKENVFYKSMDYYDVDPKIDLCLFDKNGLSYPEPQQAEDLTQAEAVSEWFAYSPEIRIETDDPDDEELHDEVMNALSELMQDVFDADEDDITDEWEDGEISFDGSLSVAGTDIGAMIEGFRRIGNILSEQESAKMHLDIGFTSENDESRPFAVLHVADDANNGMTVEYTEI